MCNGLHTHNQDSFSLFGEGERQDESRKESMHRLHFRGNFGVAAIPLGKIDSYG
jgi:hypothetical protein